MLRIVMLAGHPHFEIGARTAMINRPGVGRYSGIWVDPKA